MYGRRGERGGRRPGSLCVLSPDLPSDPGSILVHRGASAGSLRPLLVRLQCVPCRHSTVSPSPAAHPSPYAGALDPPPGRTADVPRCGLDRTLALRGDASHPRGQRCIVWLCPAVHPSAGSAGGDPRNLLTRTPTERILRCLTDLE